VAANLIMGLFLVGGLIQAFNVKQEVFPAFERDVVRVTVEYPGATPAEVEQGIVLGVEEAVRGIDGVKRVNARAEEGRAAIDVELREDANDQRVANDIRSAVDRLQTLPADAERPVIAEVIARRHVISLILHGNLPPATLRQVAEDTRSSLLRDGGITQIEISGVPERELAIEMPQEVLRAHGLTLDDVAKAVRAASVEIPGGSVRERGGEVLVRVAERRDLAPEFENIVLLSAKTGARVRLGDVARVVDGFAETDQESTFDGETAIKLDFFRVGDQSPSDVSKAVHDYLASTSLPPGVSAETWDDESQAFDDRIDVLVSNAVQGLLLVMLILGLFLEIRVAFWVMVGIPTSFLGSLLLMPLFGLSINMISLFAFIIVIGVVVDDAIVIGDSVFEMRKKGVPPFQAAVRGAQQLVVPVFFAMATILASFAPLLFVPGFIGKVFSVIPLVIILVMFVSFIESIVLLPAHLVHLSVEPGHGLIGWIHRHQTKVVRRVDRFMEHRYKPLLELVLRHRYLTGSIAVVVLLFSFVSVRTGMVEFTFMPAIESDVVLAKARLPVGASVEESRAVRDRLVAAGEQAIADHGGAEVRRGVYAQIGQAFTGGGPVVNTPARGSHIVEVALQLAPADGRDASAAAIAESWRAATGALPGIDSVTFESNTGPSAGKPVDIQIAHEDTEVLQSAAARIADGIRDYPGLLDVDAGYSNGKEQLDLKLKPAARALGLTEADLARQLRGAFHGAEALRQQRGRDEVKVVARLPAEERANRSALEQFVVRTPQGGEVPLGQAARLVPGRADTAIRRVDGRRVLDVTAEIDHAQANASKVLKRIEAEVMPGVERDHPGLSYRLEGEQREQRESLGNLAKGFGIAILFIYALLAIPFRSYTQPLLVMATVPFGIAGAVAGHWLLGHDLSVISVLGMVALTGLVVNDSLILIDAMNEYRAEGMSAHQAAVRAGVRRFRPLLLTAGTTFLGLIPMVFERSIQAKFLVPMSVSLACGEIFIVGILLTVLPAMYLINEDLLRLFGKRPPAPATDDETEAEDGLLSH
jgi:multidrug efflux pump subunit AcrB